MLWNYAAPIFLAPALEKAGSSRTESSMITVFTSYPPWSALVPVDNEIEGRWGLKAFFPCLATAILLCDYDQVIYSP